MEDLLPLQSVFCRNPARNFRFQKKEYTILVMGKPSDMLSFGL
jgi:hypothetical protein